jgi:hypothetical protein
MLGKLYSKTKRNLFFKCHPKLKKNISDISVFGDSGMMRT